MMEPFDHEDGGKAYQEIDEFERVTKVLSKLNVMEYLRNFKENKMTVSV